MFGEGVGADSIPFSSQVKPRGMPINIQGLEKTVPINAIPAASANFTPRESRP